MESEQEDMLLAWLSSAQQNIFEELEYQYFWQVVQIT